eukprot:gene15480-biopygen18711
MQLHSTARASAVTGSDQGPRTECTTPGKGRYKQHSQWSKKETEKDGTCACVQGWRRGYTRSLPMGPIDGISPAFWPPKLAKSGLKDAPQRRGYTRSLPMGPINGTHGCLQKPVSWTLCLVFDGNIGAVKVDAHDNKLLSRRSSSLQFLPTRLYWIRQHCTAGLQWIAVVEDLGAPFPIELRPYPRPPRPSLRFRLTRQSTLSSWTRIPCRNDMPRSVALQWTGYVMQRTESCRMSSRDGMQRRSFLKHLGGFDTHFESQNSQKWDGRWNTWGLMPDTVQEWHAEERQFLKHFGAFYKHSGIQNYPKNGLKDAPQRRGYIRSLPKGPIDGTHGVRPGNALPPTFTPRTDGRGPRDSRWKARLLPELIRIIGPHFARAGC